MDACSAIKNPNYLQKTLINDLKTRYPKMVHPCPYKAGEKYEVNYTYMSKDCPVINLHKPVMTGIYFWPDGDYRISLTAFVDGKKKGYLYYWYREKTADNNPW
jgi:hypothetical protein